MFVSWSLVGAPSCTSAKRSERLKRSGVARLSRTELEVCSLNLGLLRVRRSLVLSSGCLSGSSSLLEQGVDADRGRGARRVEQGDHVLDTSLDRVSGRTGYALFESWQDLLP